MNKQEKIKFQAMIQSIATTGEPVDNIWKCKCGALNSFYTTLCGSCNKSQITFK